MQANATAVASWDMDPSLASAAAQWRVQVTKPKLVEAVIDSACTTTRLSSPRRSYNPSSRQLVPWERTRTEDATRS